MGKGPCAKYTIVFARYCDRIYKKMQKKMDGRLYKQIEAEIEDLTLDPLKGKILVGDLKGMRSVRIDEFRYRIAYEVDDTRCWIIVQNIGHRSYIYDNLKAYLRSHGKARP